MGTLTAADKEELFQMAQIEHGLIPPPDKAPDLMLKPADLPVPPQPGQKIQLKGIRDVENANALKPKQHVVIGGQLTIVYGENASGKSGYARIMKKAFRARAVDPILPNVYTKAATTAATAIFEIEEDAKSRDEKWVDGKESPPCLGRFAVFDSKCARVYINDNNQLGFLPYGFDIIDGLGAITGDVKKSFQEMAVKCSPKLDALKLLTNDTATGKFIGAITAATKEDDIRSRAAWGDADTTTLNSKEGSLAKLKANSPQSLRDALIGRKRQLVTVRDAVKSMAEAITEKKLGDIKANIEELVKLEKAVETAAKATFGELNFPGIGGEVWRELLLAAAKYSTTEAFPGHSFPATIEDARCVLCLQPLDGTAQKRLASFWAFIQDDLSSKRDAAKNALALERKSLARLPRQLPNEIQILEETLRATGSTVFEKAKAFFESAVARVGAIEAAIDTNTWDAILAEPASPVQTCDDEIAVIDKELGAIVDDKKVNESIVAFTGEVAELQTKKLLSENLALVVDHLNSLKTVARASAAGNKITTNAVSLKAGELQTIFVTEAFKQRVQDELKPLNLVRVKVGIDKKSEKGKVLHKLTVDGPTGAPPEAVFSEGERTALSLACFLAELSASDDNCGIIFDDPVSSLDHRVRSAIVNRLVREAGARQVIIFTHDLVFYRELVAAAERQNVQFEFQNVEALGSATGILTDIPPLSVQKVGQRISRLEQVLKKAKDAEEAADPPLYKAALREFYDLLRSTWERSVEELLFNQVVQRMEKEVKTMSLDGVSVDSESVAAVFEGMTRASAVIEAHDHAAAENPALPTSKDLSVDLGVLKAFVVSQKAKIDGAKKQNAHLKK